MLYKLADKIATTVIFYRQGLNSMERLGVLKSSIYSVSLIITQWKTWFNDLIFNIGDVWLYNLYYLLRILIYHKIFKNKK